MNRRGFFLWLWIFLSLTPLLPAQGLDRLAGQTADSILEAAAGGATADVTIIRLENHSFLSDAEVQRLYNTIAARLEASAAIRFHDSLLSLQDGRGQFNQTPQQTATFLVAITLVTNRTRIGVGSAVFSRRLERLTAFKYWEAEVGKPELLALRALDGSFAQAGFSLQHEVEVRDQLLDIAGDQEAGGENRYYCLYPDEVEIFTVEEKAMRHVMALPLAWSRPFYPTQVPEGRIFVLRQGNELYLAVGTNSSPNSRIMNRKGANWEAVRDIPFVPFALLTINRTPFLVGAPYAPGKNFFTGRMCFLPWPATPDTTATSYEKVFPPFYAADFTSKDGVFQSVHLVGTDYLLHFYEADFSERPPAPDRQGGALAVCQDSWLALSAYTHGEDHLQIAALNGGGRRFLYSTSLPGEIGFIRAGTWEQRPGFWVLLNVHRDGATRSTLQFWGAPHAG